jgi:hypothetical protein
MNKRIYPIDDHWKLLASMRVYPMDMDKEGSFYG